MPPAPLRSAAPCWWRMRVSGVLFCWELLLGSNLWVLFIVPLPVRLPSEIQKLPPDPPVQDSPGRISVLSSFISLFIFYVLSYLLSKTMGCFSGHLMTSASDQKLFCEVCSAFGYSFDEFVGEKVVSPSYSSAILAPPLIYFYNGLPSTIISLILSYTSFTLPPFLSS